MTTNRKKKIVKQRGSRTCGRGYKKGRGAGNRGGKGMAGSGKRADQKKPSIINEYGNTYFGKKGFAGRSPVYNTINVEFLDKKLDALVKSGKAELKDNVYTIDLLKINAEKLLGKGNTKKKMRVTAEMASKSAIEKVKKAGGEVITQVQHANEATTEEA